MLIRPLHSLCVCFFGGVRAYVDQNPDLVSTVIGYAFSLRGCVTDLCAKYGAVIPDSTLAALSPPCG